MGIIKNNPTGFPGIRFAAVSIAVLSLGFVAGPADAKPEKSKITIGLPVTAATLSAPLSCPR